MDFLVRQNSQWTQVHKWSPGKCETLTNDRIIYEKQSKTQPSPWKHNNVIPLNDGSIHNEAKCAKLLTHYLTEYPTKNDKRIWESVREIDKIKAVSKGQDKIASAMLDNHGISFLNTLINTSFHIMKMPNVWKNTTSNIPLPKPGKLIDLNIIQTNFPAFTYHKTNQIAFAFGYHK